MEIVKIENLTFKYPLGNKNALTNLSLTIDSGEFVTVCGKSGSGKSTFLRQFKPLISPYGEREGRVYFGGEDLFLMSQREQSEKIGFVFQNPDNQIVTDKVYHELAFGLENLGLSSKEIRAKVGEMASFFGLQGWFDKNINELSGGQKQILNLAAVMAMQPQIIILDEPTSQLDPIAATDFLNMLQKVNRELGTTVILSEHRLEEVFAISDKVVVLENGEILTMGSPRKVGRTLKEKKSDMAEALPTPMRVHFAVSEDEDCPLTVREGRRWIAEKEVSTEISFERKNDNKGPVVISMKDVWFRYEKNLPDVIKGLSLSVKQGEIYAITGGNGTGKTTSLMLLSSLLKQYRGEIDVSGKIAMLPQNPQAVFTENSLIGDLNQMLENKKFSKEDKDKMLKDVISLCELNELIYNHPYDLSGGELQRAALAKVLLSSPDILLLDEPTKGLDAHYKNKLGEILTGLKESGITVVMVSHDIEFCAEYTDRCGMFFDGDIISEDMTRPFFSGKSFYTTAANRMAREKLPLAVLTEDIILALGGNVGPKQKGQAPALELNKDEQEKTKAKKLTVKNIIWGGVFLTLFVLLQIFFGSMFNDGRKYIVQILGFLLLALSLTNLVPQKELGKQNSGSKDKKLVKRTLIASFLILITIPLTIYVGSLYFGNKKYFLISTLIILQTMIPFMLLFENRKPKSREIVIISVLCGIAVAGRVVFSAIPQFKPLLAVAIVAAVSFGGETGFLVGAISIFVSNFFLAQGMWTPWQMFAAGIIGFIAGILFKKGFIRKTRGSLCIYGGLSTLLIYGIIMNTASVIIYQPNPTTEMFLSAYLLGFPMDVIHAISTVLFLWFASPLMLEKLMRVQEKYGIVD